MSFGKRRTEPRPNAGSGSHPSATSEASSEQRLQGLRDALLGLFASAARLSDAVRTGGTISMPVISGEPDPEAGPLSLTGFVEHFSYLENGRVCHCILAYGQPGQEGGLDPNAQFHLHELTGRILELNLFCQQAEIDGALSVALQAPLVPALLDAIVSQTAFFAGLVDNILIRQMDGGGPDAPPNLPAERANLERHKLMGADKMLDPARLEALLPVRHSPLTAVMVPIEPHAGDYFINSVYFPAEHAEVLLSRSDADDQRAA
ncbi:MAG: hypothetical protein SFW09_08385 [Hyphomicrobiaceae bacterium]|nr:hypothetical protein [Hyphomicrobiaceae bacterium]